MHGIEGSRAKCILKNELLRGGEQSQTLSLVPQHYLFCSFATIMSQPTIRGAAKLV